MKKAFSLIELSIVILIIGILIAGVTQSSRLIAQMRLTTARSLTQSSPVSSIRNLVLWLESTSEKSFTESESEDGLTLSNWYDINPQSLNKKTITASAVKPIYLANGINNLPAVDFNGTTQHFEYAYDAELNPSNMSVFIVFNADNVGASTSASLISSRNSVSGNLFGYMFYARTSATPGFDFTYGNGTTSWSSSTYTFNPLPYGKTKIFSATHDGTNSKNYIDGVAGSTTAVTLSPNTARTFRIGAGQNESTANFFYDGKIGEIIIFDRALKTEERQSIEKYLGQKWGVKTN